MMHRLLLASPFVQVLFEVAEGGEIVGVVATRAAYRSGLLLVDDVAKRRVEEILPTTCASCLRDAFRDALRLGEPASLEEFVMLGGRERWWMTTATPLLDERGYPEHVMASFVDLEVLKHTEAELRRLETSFRALVEASSDAILIVRNGAVIDGNAAAAKLFHVPEGALVGCPLATLAAHVEVVKTPLGSDGSMIVLVRPG